MSSYNRKRSASDADDDANSSPPPNSSPFPSSPPAGPLLGEEIEDDALRNDIDDLEELAEEEDGVDLYGDNFERDYKESNENDRYDLENIDDADYDAIDIAERRAIDERLNRRDRALRHGLPDAFIDDQEEDYTVPTQRRHRRHYDEERDMLSDIDPMEEELSLSDLADMKASNISEWISMPAVHKSISREFKMFLLEYTDENGRSVYGTRIRLLGEVNSESLTISYSHLAESKAILAYFLTCAPTEVLKIFDIVAMQVIELHYPDYYRIHSEVHVRVSDVPTTFSLRELRESHLGSLVSTTGVVTRRTGVFPQLKYIKFNCTKCGTVLGPFAQENNQREIKISFCHACQSRGPFVINSEQTIYTNYQKITLQESPGTVPAGRLPRHRDIILLWDLIDSAKPGDEIDITGIYKNSYDAALNAKNGFPVFSTIIEANYVQRGEGRSQSVQCTEAELDQIKQLSHDKNIIDKIINSIAPSIYGHKDIKTAIALSLFGGVSKNINGKHSIRGDINVLLLGDPGTAKSQFLKYTEKTAYRAVFATGQGASAVGLTASVRRDPITLEWTLEGGALVLADKGTCLIDEFDKMNDQDRTSIHEAMEQQSISISKAGIVTTLQARCGIIAAANPIGGRYNATIPFSSNVHLTEPILSRFDILCVVRDFVNPDMDEKLASFVVESHARSHPLSTPTERGSLSNLRWNNNNKKQNRRMNKENNLETSSNISEEDNYNLNRNNKNTNVKNQNKFGNDSGLIDQKILVKYIHYARENISPKLMQVDEDKIAKVYADMRRESLSTGAFPITVRHLESILRCAESFAKMRLSEYVSSYDIDRAIKVSIESFVGAQKIGIRKALERRFMKYTLPNDFNELSMSD